MNLDSRATTQPSANRVGVDWVPLPVTHVDGVELLLPDLPNSGRRNLSHEVCARKKRQLRERSAVANALTIIPEMAWRAFTM